MRFVLLAVTLATVGCGGASTTANREPDRTSVYPTEMDVDEISRVAGPALYFLGDSYNGLPLTHVFSERPGYALFIYGTCNPLPNGCVEPLQIQQRPIDAIPWRLAVGCVPTKPVRGVPAVIFDSLMLFTGPSTVKIYFNENALPFNETRRVANALRPANAEGSPGAPLPRPEPAAYRRAEEACSAPCQPIARPRDCRPPTSWLPTPRDASG